tara:strand:- start:76 stop:228 length:153 start_codon:yes stop_codon:yes gene_type:complete
MSKYKFVTKNGTNVSACETDDEQKAWKWISQTKKLTIEQAQKLYTITKIN